MSVEAMIPVLARLDVLDEHADARVIVSALRPLVHTPSVSGTMAKWFRVNDGNAVHTVQVDNRTGAVWAPLNRTVDATTRKTSVRLDESTRDYAGMRVVSVSVDALVVADDWHTIAYVVVPN